MGNQVLGRPVIAATNTPSLQTNGGGLLIRSIGRVGLAITPVFSYFFLWAPIFLLVLFSFNDSAKDTNTWHGFTLQWYTNIFNGVVGGEARFSTSLMVNALTNTLIVSGIATVIATLIGTMVALSLARSNLPGKRILDGMIFLPVVIPEITQGVSLAIFFKIAFDFINSLAPGANMVSGFGTIIIGHVAFNISYVAVVVRARLANMNPRLEEAANDLGANTWQTFRRITLPLILPGIVAGALLALTLSMDDLVVTFFNSGVGTTTLPVFVYGLIKTAVTPEVNALSTLMLVFSTVVVGASLYLQNRYSDRPVSR